MGGLQSIFGDPEALLGAIQTPDQLRMLPAFEALITVVVGYVDHVMDGIGHGLLSSYSMVTEAVRRRRVEADESTRFVERLFGLELTQAQYDRGTNFVSGVVERAGDEGLARLWAREQDLPTPAEVDAPGLWLARIDLPTRLIRLVERGRATDPWLVEAPGGGQSIRVAPAGLGEGGGVGVGGRVDEVERQRRLDHGGIRRRRGRIHGCMAPAGGRIRRSPAAVGGTKAAARSAT